VAPRARARPRTLPSRMLNAPFPPARADRQREKSAQDRQRRPVEEIIVCACLERGLRDLSIVAFAIVLIVKEIVSQQKRRFALPNSVFVCLRCKI
jgi:hypothetical protein